MFGRSKPDPQPTQDRTPRPSTILEEPATVEACADDYRAAAADRLASERKDQQAARRWSR